MRKILVIGSGGSGKTTLATEIGARMGLPVIHLDTLYWRAGWVETPAPEWQAIVGELVLGPAWVMDGNYGGTLDTRLAACDTVVFLDIPRLVCLWRVLRRSIRYYGRSRPDLAPGCPEQLPTWDFAWWIWSYRTRRRPEILRRLAALGPAKRVFVLRSSADMTRFLEGLRSARPFDTGAPSGDIAAGHHRTRQESPHG